MRFVFSVIVATVSETFEDDDDMGSKVMLLPDTPSHTCIAWYGCTREAAMCFHAPVSFKNLTEPGVKELHLLEKVVDSGWTCDLLRSCPSTRAILRFAVLGEAPT